MLKTWLNKNFLENQKAVYIIIILCFDFQQNESQECEFFSVQKMAGYYIPHIALSGIV